MPLSAILEGVGLERRFGASRALANIDLSVRSGELLVLLGPNGAGKTTLLRMLAGLLRPSKGEVRINGRSLAEAPEGKRAIGVVSQFKISANALLQGRRFLSLGVRVRRLLDIRRGLRACRHHN